MTALLKRTPKPVFTGRYSKKRESSEKTFEIAITRLPPALSKAQALHRKCLDELLIMTDEGELRKQVALLAWAAGYWMSYADFSLLKSLSPRVK